jgi:imidazolonepropionase-like amidohydrolase
LVTDFIFELSSFIKGGILFMKRLYQLIWVVLFIVIVSPGVLASSDKSFAFIDVNVIPMDQEHVLLNQTVIIREDRIVEIGPVSSTNVSSDVNRINATGKYLIPALSDMHVHLEGGDFNMLFPPGAQFSPEDLDFNKILFPYVAYGVTTIQVLGALQEHIHLRDQINQGDILGPRMILGRMIDGPEQAWPPPLSIWVKTAAEARQAVLDAYKEGYDMMKVYTFLSQECYDTIISTAKEIGMPVIGHIPNALSVEYILEAEQNLIAHSEEVMRHAKGNYDKQQIEYFSDIIAESDTWIIPTLITTRQILAIFDNLDGELSKPEVRYIHPMAQGIWLFLSGNYLKMSPGHRQGIREGFELFQLPFTKALHDKGVKLMIGTDALIPTVIPGFSLHSELEELVGVGLTPYEALRTSTTHPFEFLGELDDAGTVEVGKRANLVLLEANPLKHITNSRKIAGVMIQGNWLSKTELQEGLEEVVAFYETLNK